MNKRLDIWAVALLLVYITGCSSPQGISLDEKQGFVRKMRDDTLQELYSEIPGARDKIKNAVGYGVFSNANVNIIFASAGDGYGIVVENETGKETFMKMGMGGLGLGIGIKDYRSILIFYTKLALLNFVEKGWEFGGHVDAAAKSGDKGGAIGGAGEIKSDVEIYQFTKHGIALQATVTGAKYWKDNDLNQ
ncbi:MAG: lipid-binding SYLF domain-containing protein [Planctomycetota bacterium]